MQEGHLYIIAFAFIVIAGSPFNVLAQTEADEERSSLRGLNGVGFTVNIEQNTAYADTQLVNISTVKKLGMQELEKAEITIFDDIEIQESIRTPVLYMHINLLSTRTGIISFSVTVSLYQPVKLVLNRDKQATAITWENSIVGIASYDKIGVIKQAVVGMIQSFIDDYQKVNSN
jgi:hypothetical protein